MGEGQRGKIYLPLFTPLAGFDFILRVLSFSLREGARNLFQ